MRSSPVAHAVISPEVSRATNRVDAHVQRPNRDGSDASCHVRLYPGGPQTGRPTHSFKRLSQKGSRSDVRPVYDWREVALIRASRECRARCCAVPSLIRRPQRSPRNRIAYRRSILRRVRPPRCLRRFARMRQGARYRRNLRSRPTRCLGALNLRPLTQPKRQRCPWSLTDHKEGQQRVRLRRRGRLHRSGATLESEELVDGHRATPGQSRQLEPGSLHRRRKRCAALPKRRDYCDRARSVLRRRAQGNSRPQRFSRASEFRFGERPVGGFPLGDDVAKPATGQLPMSRLSHPGRNVQ